VEVVWAFVFAVNQVIVVAVCVKSVLAFVKACCFWRGRDWGDEATAEYALVVCELGITAVVFETLVTILYTVFQVI
jgi:hypothetical protein